jgi:hypothetical protein
MGCLKDLGANVVQNGNMSVIELDIDSDLDCNSRRNRATVITPIQS